MKSKTKIEANLGLATELISDLVLVIRADGTILDTNTTPLKKYGFTKSEIVGKKITDASFMPLESKKVVLQNLSQRLQGKEIAPYEI
ncbi:MAG: PAS domain S-box protein, partial [Dehalococcoidia bacterium]